MFIFYFNETHFLLRNFYLKPFRTTLSTQQHMQVIIFLIIQPKFNHDPTMPFTTHQLLSTDVSPQGKITAVENYLQPQATFRRAGLGLQTVPLWTFLRRQYQATQYDLVLAKFALTTFIRYLSLLFLSKIKTLVSLGHKKRAEDTNWSKRQSEKLLNWWISQKKWKLLEYSTT